MALMRVFLSVACLIIASMARADMLDTESMQPWEVCGMCHGLTGVSRMSKFPILAGQHESYIEQQLKNFKLGVRDNDGGQMSAMASELSEAQIDQVAKYFAAQPPAAVSEPSDIPLYKTGRLLFEKKRKAEVACMHCHGVNTTAGPRLFGQHQAYLEKQLFDFEQGRRAHLRNASVETLAVEEVEALAYYLSTTTPASLLADGANQN